MLSQLPFAVDTIQTDNGAEFQSAFHWHVLDKGINHTYIKPRTPRLNAKVERSHRIDADRVVIDDVNICNAKLKDWQDYYNYHRPHGGLNGQTPYERLQQKTQTEVRMYGVGKVLQLKHIGRPAINDVAAESFWTQSREKIHRRHSGRIVYKVRLAISQSAR